MKNNWPILLASVGLILFTGTSLPFDKKVWTVFPSPECGILHQGIDEHTVKALFNDNKSIPVVHRVNDFGIWSFVYEGDTTYRRIGVYPVSGQFVTHSALCWASTEDSIPNWLSSDKIRSEQEFVELMEAESIFLQTFRNDVFHLGWASQMPIPETVLARREIETILGDSIWIPDSIRTNFEVSYFPVFALFSLYQSFYNTDWIREMIAQKIKITAGIYSERGWAVRLDLGAIQAAASSSALVQIEVHPYSSLVRNYPPCYTVSTPTAPYLKAIEIFNLKVSDLTDSEELPLPPWCSER